jgi:hypothetical protein
VIDDANKKLLLGSVAALNAVVPLSFAQAPTIPTTSEKTVAAEFSTPAPIERAATIYSEPTRFVITPQKDYQNLLNLVGKLTERPTRIAMNRDWSSQLNLAGLGIAANVRALSIDILQSFSKLGASEPVIDSDDEGGVEIFFKEATALLVHVSALTDVTFFGDDGRGQWRAKYLNGTDNWKLHLVSFFDGLYDNERTARPNI